MTGDFGTVSELLRRQARVQPDRAALIHGGRSIDFRTLDEMADRIAAALQRDRVRPRDIVAICAAASLEYVGIFFGCLRAGVAVAPLGTTWSSQALAAMMVDAGAKKIFLDGEARDASCVVLGDPGARGLMAWLGDADSVPAPVEVRPHWPFNVIYSSGTTATPKGIVQPHSFRWSNVQRAAMNGYGPGTMTLLSTPLYSNTTLATLFGALALGGTVALMTKFSAEEYLRLAEELRATHTMLVPVQYQRLLAAESFDRCDLTSFRAKFSTGAPFPAALKKQVLERWPGGLIEYYGMTEGGATCMLEAHKYPDKLHTVGKPLPRNEIRVIDGDGRELAAGEVGEFVGHSPAMMTGYLNQPAKSAEAEWHDADGKRFIRTGDVGRIDSDGFLILLDRKKDMIISGGFNVFPSDIEAVLREHPDVEEAAVAGMPSARWGETPVGFVVLKDGAALDAADLTAWANQRLGKMQRLASVQLLPSLPRNAAGKVLKRELTGK